MRGLGDKGRGVFVHPFVDPRAIFIHACTHSHARTHTRSLAPAHILCHTHPSRNLSPVHAPPRIRPRGVLDLGFEEAERIEHEVVEQGAAYSTIDEKRPFV